MITARDTLGMPDTMTLGSVVLRAFQMWQTREKRSQTKEKCVYVGEHSVSMQLNIGGMTTSSRFTSLTCKAK